MPYDAISSIDKFTFPTTFWTDFLGFEWKSNFFLLNKIIILLD